MKEEKGFTIIELILSFSITVIVVVLLFQLLIFLRDIYNHNGYKTELFIKQALISKEINDDLENKTITEVASCGKYCLTFTFGGGASKELSVDQNSKILTYGDFVTKLVFNSEIGDFVVVKEETTTPNSGYNSFVSIKIPLSYPLYEEEDFGIHLLYQYDNNNEDVEVVN